MLANLMPPPATMNSGTREVEEYGGEVTHAADGRGAFFVAHPRYRVWLAKVGVRTSADALSLPGEVVSGHPARHVARVELGRRGVYLKREHVVGWRVRLRNARAGFGWVSRSEREAATLRALECRGLPSPQWLAYGEDGTGRAFLLVDELAGALELRQLLGHKERSSAVRRRAAVELGRAVATLHNAGFDTPELSAKHVFTTSQGANPTIIDWQSTGQPCEVGSASRARALAGLLATLGHNRTGLRTLWAYHKAAHWSCRQPTFGDWVRMVRRHADRIAEKSSVHDQLAPPARAQRLVWLAGEAVCVRPDAAAGWPQPPVCEPFYPGTGNLVRVPGSLRGFVSFARPQWLDRFLGRPWRSPATSLARVYFALERRGVPTPRLIAFGQRSVFPFRGQGFVLSDLPANVATAGQFLRTHTGEVRRRVFFELGAAVRAAHDARCQLTNGDVARVIVDTVPRLVLDPAAGLVKVRAAGRVVRERDLRRVLASLPESVSRADRLRVVFGYFAGDTNARTAARDAARRTLGGKVAR